VIKYRGLEGNRPPGTILHGPTDFDPLVPSAFPTCRSLSQRERFRFLLWHSHSTSVMPFFCGVAESERDCGTMIDWIWHLTFDSNTVSSSLKSLTSHAHNSFDEPWTAHFYFLSDRRMHQWCPRTFASQISIFCWEQGIQDCAGWKSTQTTSDHVVTTQSNHTLFHDNNRV